jgi:hypothetical protein
MDCYLPDRELHRRNPETRYEERTFRHPHTQHELYSWEQSCWDEATKRYTVTYTYQDLVTAEEWRVRLALRMFELDELHDMFERSGFQIVLQCGDFDRSPLRPNALKWVGLLKHNERQQEDLPAPERGPNL